MLLLTFIRFSKNNRKKTLLTLLIICKEVLYLSIQKHKKQEIMKKRRRVRVQNERSKYRFSKSKSYCDKDGNVYQYDGKNSGGVFQFYMFKDGSSRLVSFYERDLDKLQLKER